MKRVWNKNDLLQVQEIIGHEIEERLRNLSDLKQEIVDYRKFLIEEIPQKQYHSLNQDNPVREASYKATYERLGALSRMYYYPYFGKIVLKDPLEAEEEEYFIGKNGLEVHSNPIILDWRTPYGLSVLSAASGHDGGTWPECHL